MQFDGIRITSIRNGASLQRPNERMGLPGSHITYLRQSRKNEATLFADRSTPLNTALCGTGKYA